MSIRARHRLAILLAPFLSITTVWLGVGLLTDVDLIGPHGWGILSFVFVLVPGAYLLELLAGWPLLRALQRREAVGYAAGALVSAVAGIVFGSLIGLFILQAEPSLGARVLLNPALVTGTFGVLCWSVYYLIAVVA